MTISTPEHRRQATQSEAAVGLSHSPRSCISRSITVYMGSPMKPRVSRPQIQRPKLWTQMSPKLRKSERKRVFVSRLHAAAYYDPEGGAEHAPFLCCIYLSVDTSKRPIYQETGSEHTKRKFRRKGVFLSGGYTCPSTRPQTAGKKTRPLRCHFIAKNDHLTKTGSGQT